MQPLPIVIFVIFAGALAIAAAAKDDIFELRHDLSMRDPAKFYDFNVDLLTHLGKRVKIEVTVAARDLDRKTGWLGSSYYITPDELRGIELRVPASAISEDGKDRLRVRGEFKLSEVMSHRQGQISLHLLPAE